MKNKEIKDCVKRFMASQEEDTFVPNKHGNFVYYSENGVSGINLTYIFEDLLEFALGEKEEQQLKKK